MNLVLEGILLGLTLAVLTGPLFLTLVNTSIKRGTKEGLAVGTGIWTSDFFIMGFAYLFIEKYAPYIENDAFRFWLGIGGGIILIIIGVFSTISSSESKQSSYPQYLRYLGYWGKGFAINTFNPFTFIFWFGVISTYMIGRTIPNDQIIIFLSTILVVIILTDTVKVLAADKFSKLLNTHYITVIQKIAGLAFIIFGIALIIKSI